MIISAYNLCKQYQDIQVLDNFNLEVFDCESVAIIGASGSGKSTLLNILGGIDFASSGEIINCGKNLSTSNEKELANFRANNLGFVYQFHHLLPDFNALENVEIPLFIKNMNKYQAKQQAVEILEKVGLSKRVSHFPAQLSGGERQRVAIARAMVGCPRLILADEPTGNLDKNNANIVLNLLLTLCKENNSSLVIVTHDDNIADQTDRKINL